MRERREPTVRLQIMLPERSAERIGRLIDTTEASSMAEVTRHALQLYEAVVQGAREGRPFFQRIDGKMVPVIMLVTP